MRTVSEAEPTARLKVSGSAQKQIVNRRDHAHGASGARYIARGAHLRDSAQLGESITESDERRVRQRTRTSSCPPVFEPIDRRLFRNVERVLIGLIDLGEGLDQIDGVGFIAAELGSDGMRVNTDVQKEAVPPLRICLAEFPSRGRGK